MRPFTKAERQQAIAFIVRHMRVRAMFCAELTPTLDAEALLAREASRLAMLSDADLCSEGARLYSSLLTAQSHEAQPTPARAAAVRVAGLARGAQLRALRAKHEERIFLAVEIEMVAHAARMSGDPTLRPLTLDQLTDRLAPVARQVAIGIPGHYAYSELSMRAKIKKARQQLRKGKQ